MKTVNVDRFPNFLLIVFFNYILKFFLVLTRLSKCVVLTHVSFKQHNTTQHNTKDTKLPCKNLKKKI